MRLIDADALANKLIEQFSCKRDMQSEVILNTMLWKLNQAPSADAVLVVRCKDCKHWYNDGDAITWCNLSKWACGGNGFCLYGERKDDETD